MVSRYASFPVLIMVLLASFAPAAFANEKDAEATALIEHARQLSDIRAEGSPAFKVRLIFKIIKKNGSALEGEYGEVWVSKGQWQKDTVAGPFHSVEVANGQKRWILDSKTPMPEHLMDIPGFLELATLRSDVLRPQKIASHDRNGLKLRCLEAGQSSLCFDTASGALVHAVWATPTGTGVQEKSCSYSDYQKFGDHLVARSYACTEGDQTKIEGKIVELAADPAPDQSLFTPPDGAEESVNCLGRLLPPQVLRYSHATFEGGMPSGSTEVVISMLVPTNGDPQDFRVLSAPDKELDNRALKMVKQYKFKPATCDGEPIEFRIMAEIGFPF